jgi:hypothetical protein
MGKYVYKIHPAIGIARVGPGTDPYDAPTTEGGLPDLGPTLSFRDKEGRIRPQAAVFQVYRYDSEDPADHGTPVKIGEGGVTDIKWTVWLANKKACWFKFQGPVGEIGGYKSDHELRDPDIKGPDRQNLILDPGPRSVSKGSGSKVFDLGPKYENLKPFPLTSLGSINTDAAGQLRVVGASGNAGQKVQPGVQPSLPQPPGNFANNAGWFDDISDGPVSATISVGGEPVEVDVPAWVLCTPPKYAPQLVNMVDLYDTIYDVSVRELGYRPELYDSDQFKCSYIPNFKSEILPILKRPDMYQWVAKLSAKAVGNHANVAAGEMSAQDLLEVIRSPYEPNIQKTLGGIVTMPYLAGDNPVYDKPPTAAPQVTFLTLTKTQYFLIQQWAAGIIDMGEPKKQPPGLALDHGVLTNCVGGPFVPGIEMTWICRKTEIYLEPFRIRHKQGLEQGKLFYPKPDTGYDFKKLFHGGVEPGDLSAFMAQPWQSDFNLCSSGQGDKADLPALGFGVKLKFALWWWPAQRPDWVFQPSSSNSAELEQVKWIASSSIDDTKLNFPNALGMIENWMNLGFVMGKDDSPPFVLVDTA